MHGSRSVFGVRARAGVCAALVLLGAGAAGAATLPAGFVEQTFGGITMPTALAFAPDGRVFVSQQCGQIRVIKNGALLSTPFASIAVSCSNERGLHSIAFDPAFATNGFVYVRYTRSSPVGNVIGRLQASPSNPDISTGPPTVIFTIPFRDQPFHHGGGLVVGGDGKLYSSIGDHMTDSGQGTSNLWGKVVRLNMPDGSIPADNPFPTASGNNRAIWATGFRNPFTMAVQRGSGRIHVNDVGDRADACCEEVNVLARAANYGWGGGSGTTPRYFGYTASSQGGNAIAGGGFYNPETVTFPSSYVGRYFFADYGGGWIRSILGSGSAGSLTTFASGISGPTDVEAAADGSLWYTARNSNNVRRITFGTPTPTPTPTGGPTATPTPTRPPGSAPVPVIIEPRPGKKYRGGETIHFSGDCTDAEDGVIPDSGISWTVTFHHTDHTHGLQEFIGVREGDFTIPVEGEWDPIQWYRLQMFCTDSAAQTASTMLDFSPLLSRLTLSSVPAGATLAGNGVSAPAPHSFDAIVGTQRNLIAPSPQLLEATPYFFQSWSDGGAQQHHVIVPEANTTYTARFLPQQSYTEAVVPAARISASTSDANVPANTMDDNLATRWSANGDNQWIRFDLGSARMIGHVRVAVYQGNVRRNRFDIQTANALDGPWSTAFSGESSGTTIAEELYDFADVPARYVRYLGHGNVGASNPFINSVTEISLLTMPLPRGMVLITSTGFDPSFISFDYNSTTVTWLNVDTQPHTTTSPPTSGLPPFSGWNSGVLQPGQSFSRFFSEHGTFNYRCDLHPQETGTVQSVFRPPTPPTPTPTPTSPVDPTPTRTPTPTPTPTLPPPECVESTIVLTSASTNDGNVPANAVDNNLATRWSGNGDGAWLNVDLGSMKIVCSVKIAWYQGDTRSSRFDLQKANAPGETFVNIQAGLASTGSTNGEETFDFTDTPARVIRYLGHGNDLPAKATWNSVTEISVFARPLPNPTPIVAPGP
jgi:glucose/arabinose dehydrogenase